MKKKANALIYEPVAGLTILGAFLEAIKIAKENHKTVHAIINDVEMNVTSRTNPERAVAIYQKKNQQLYEAEMRAYEQQQKRKGR
ncbi:MAG: hypothetical protein II942_00250 [Alphaproteobacteria bacterium]|nr:hypothetical protein [Alphaproteobacteria bacterium]